MFLRPRPLDFYLETLELAGLKVESVREASIEAGVQDWFELLATYHDAVLGWVGGTEKIDGAAPSPEAVADRLELMRHAMDVLFHGRPDVPGVLDVHHVRQRSMTAGAGATVGTVERTLGECS